MAEAVAENIEEKNVLDYESGYHETRHPNHSNDEYYNARAKIALNKFFGDIDIKKRILDYGCGLGQNIFYLPNAVGYDISEYGVEQCRNKGINATTKLEEIPDKEFDYVFSSHVLEHHPHPKEMIGEMREKLKPGNDLLLVIPFERHGKAKFELDLNQHLHNWNFQNINNLLITCGFEIQQNKYLYGAGYNRLLPLSRLSFGLYRFATHLISRVFGIKEMMIVAKKK